MIAAARSVMPGAQAVPRPAPGPGERLLGAALLFGIVVAAVEGPIRSLLHAVRLDELIFLRDAALLLAVVACVGARAQRGESCAAVGVFALILAAHGAVSALNLHSALPAVYGVKLALPALCGFLAWRAVYEPGRGVVWLMAALWLALVIGAAIDKSMPGDMPWVGTNVELGGIDVALARDWQSGAVKRVGGLTRSSLSLAVIAPLLAVMVMTRLRSRWAALAIGIVTLVVLGWTTQKGAILALLLAFGALAAASRIGAAPLRLALVAAAVLLVFAPTVLIHFDMPQDRGVFSFESFISRIQQMWPDAWHWIGRFPLLAGVGLGGIGGAQRFYAPADFNAADNLFIYLYANFGAMALAYLAAVLYVGLAAPMRRLRPDGLALASLVFLLAYGIVISLLEDQIAALWMGATVGLLAARLRRGEG